MLKFPRTALGRLCLATFALVAAASATFWRPASEPALRDGVFERSAKRLTTDGGDVWESVGDFNGGVGVKMESWGGLARFGVLRGTDDRFAVERFLADFDDRLCVGAVEFWTTRRSASGARGALRAVADGWARWNVGPEATERFLATLTAAERSAFERRRREGAAFDFATERAASAVASREAASTLTTLKWENEEDSEAGNGGVDAALAFLRSLDGDEIAADDGRGDINKGSEPDGEPFLWAAAFDGNPLNAVGAFGAADVVAPSLPALGWTVERARSAFAASATFFFLSAFGVFGGVPPRTLTELWGGVGENRSERDFWRLLEATFRRFGVALANLGKLLYFARLALFNAFRRFGVEDGVASKRAAVALLASTRLLF